MTLGSIVTKIEETVDIYCCWRNWRDWELRASCAVVGKFFAGWNKRHILINTTSTEWSPTRQRIRTTTGTLHHVCERITTLDQKWDQNVRRWYQTLVQNKHRRGRAALQEDLDKLSSWSNIWQLKFNAEKCKVMHIGHTCKTNYYISGKTKLESVQEESDLRVLIEQVWN